jgi:hypothetical protein
VTWTWTERIFIRDEPVFSSKRMLYRDYELMGSVEKISGRESQGE